MKVEEVNNVFRIIFQQLIDDGYKKRHICSLTLGVQSEPQFEGFLQGKEFGIKPLQRIVDAFGYDLRIVMVEKSDIETKNSINNMNDDNLKNCKTNLVKSLDNEDKIKSSSVIKSGILAEISNELFSNIIGD